LLKLIPDNDWGEKLFALAMAERVFRFPRGTETIKFEFVAFHRQSCKKICQKKDKISVKFFDTLNKTYLSLQYKL